MAGLDTNYNPLIDETEEGFITRLKKVLETQTGYSFSELQKRNRTQKKVFARYIYLYMVKARTQQTLKEIGSEFGFDHTSVLHGINQVNNAIKTEYDPIKSLLLRVQNSL